MSENITLENFEQSHVDDSDLKTPEEIKERIEEINKSKEEKEKELEKINDKLEELNDGDENHQGKLKNEKENIEKQIKEKEAKLKTQDDNVNAVTGNDNEQNKLNDELNQLNNQVNKIEEKLEVYNRLQREQMTLETEIEKSDERIKNLQQRQLELQPAPQPVSEPQAVPPAQEQEKTKTNATPEQSEPQEQPEPENEWFESIFNPEKQESETINKNSTEDGPFGDIINMIEDNPQSNRLTSTTNQPQNRTKTQAEFKPSQPRVKPILPETRRKLEIEAHQNDMDAEHKSYEYEEESEQLTTKTQAQQPAQPEPQPEKPAEQSVAEKPQQTNAPQQQPAPQQTDATPANPQTAQPAQAEMPGITETGTTAAALENEVEADPAQLANAASAAEETVAQAPSVEADAAGAAEDNKKQAQQQPKEQQAEKSEQKAEKLTWETAYTIYDTAKTDLEQAEGAFNRVYESFRKGDSSLSSPENLLILVNKKYGKNGEKYDELIESLEDEIKRKKEEISKKTGKENLDINEIDKKIEEVKSNLTTQDKQLEQAEKKFKGPDKAWQKINDKIKEISEELTENFSSISEKIKENNTLIESNNTLNTVLNGIKTKNLNFLNEIDPLIKNINTPKIAEDFDFKKAYENINKLLAETQNTKKEFEKVLNNQITPYSSDYQSAIKINSEFESMQETVKKIQELAEQKKAQQDMQKPESEFMKAQSEVKNAENGYKTLQSNLKTLNNTKDALEEIQKLQQDIEEIKQAKTVTEKFNDAITKEKEAGDVLGEIQKKTYIDELVSRLKDGKWSERTTTFEGKTVNLNEEINGLEEKFQKYFLTKALKQIYNSNNGNGEELQKQLGLDKNNNKEGIINYCIEETVKRCFENKYQKKLFAKTRPSSEKNRINLAEIIKDINDTLKIEQNKAEQVRKQAKGPTEFDKKVQERIVETVNLVKQGKVKTFRESYKQNSKDPVKHEIDVVALNGLKNTSKEQKKIYRKVVPLLFIHGTYAKMKFDQLNYDNRYKALDKVLANNKLQNVKKFSKTLQKHPNDPGLIEGIKSACDQNEKLQGKALNAILPATKNIVIEDVDVLKKAFGNIPQEDNGYSMTKPMKDDMAYFKILYARANEETRDDFLNSEEFTTKFNNLSAEKQKKFIHFLVEDIGEKEKIDRLGLKPQQDEELSEGQSFSDKDIFKDWDKNGISASAEKDNNSKENSKEEQLAPFYVFNQEGMSIKNDENLLAKETFKLQDSFLGLACAKDKKAFVLSNWMRAKQTRDKDGKKIEDKDEQITSAQVKAQRAAEKAAEKAIKEAGGDFNAIKKKTMPLLKNTKITFTFHGKPIPLSQAVRVCIELERRSRERELNMGIIRGEKIPEKTLIERISERLRLNVKEGCFSDEEKQLVQEAISAQIIATKAFNEELKNQIEAKGLENGKKQVAQKQKTTNNVLGALQSLENGQSQQKPGATMTINKSKLKEQIKQQAQNPSQEQLQPTPQHSDQEADSPVSTDKSSTKLETGSQPSIQQNGKQSLKDSAIIGDLATGIKKAAEAQPIQPANEERSILI